ncbi:MAG TPA: bifunctional hydroxymethylpyrimidine kinase/phosphomethylpyrimidine kinase [Thermoplasmata archaeon]|nr:MAG TPA: bifunctional hydroxymethylpyrimidine kinase/phosphomethylpyrimidine kinase [Thermoplasmata archaeon]
MEKKVALSIAGSDSCGGAGIQADLKSFSYLGVHGVTVISCVTAQNTQQVRTIYKVPVDVIENQIESLFDDFSIAAVKIGMLYDEEIVKLASRKLKARNRKPIVDPVMVATSGDALSNNTFAASLKQYLLPQALMVTANIPEACTLADMPITQQKDIEKAAKKIFALGPEFVLLKGGHFPGDMVTDLLYDGKQFHRFVLPRIPQRKAHGSGCTLSALITGLLALEESPVAAVEKAKSITWSMINEGYFPGKGADVLNHSSTIQVPPLVTYPEQFEVWLQLKNAIEALVCLLPPQFIPEVGMNFTYALPDAKTRNDVCAIQGRITRHKEHPALCGTLAYGASKHVAAIVLAAMSFDPSMRSALNIRYAQKTLRLCTSIGFTTGSFDRKDEPSTAPSTMEWGTKHAITMLRRVPDIIYDTGSVGKEPMIRVLGKNPQDVLFKIKTLVNASIPYDTKLRNVYK